MKPNLDVAEVVHYLSDGSKEAESHWWSFATRCLGHNTSTTDVSGFCDTVRREWKKRQAFEISTELNQGILEAYDVEEALEKAIEKFSALQQLGYTERQTLLEEATETLEKFNLSEAKTLGLSSGVGLEKVVPGGIPGDKVTVIFGETGTFKTTLKSNIIDAICREGHVIDFSLEDSNALTVRRAIARRSGIPYSKLVNSTLSDRERELLLDVNLDIYKNVTVIGDVPPTADQIISTARQYLSKGLKAVVVDYITLLDWGRLGERAMLNDAMLKFQRAAKRDRVAYIVISQLNDERLHERGRPDARPILRDLFGSSSLRTACKLAVATYRPGKYGPPKTRYDKERYGEIYSLAPEVYDDIIELWVRKNIVGDDNIPVYVECNRKTGLMTPTTLDDLLEKAKLIG